MTRTCKCLEELSGRYLKVTKFYILAIEKGYREDITFYRKEDFRYKTSSAVGRKKSMNFSAQECSLLLKLVKEEKHNLFLPGLTKEIVRKKYLAWERVCYFNTLYTM